MLKKIILIVGVSIYANATTMVELFEGLENQPISKIDSLSVKDAELNKKSKQDLLYPKLFGSFSYEHYNQPANIAPLPPTHATQMLQNNEPLPFSNNISKIGVAFDFPIFVKSLYTIQEKASILKVASQDKKRLAFIQREASILGANANLKYLENLQKALDIKKVSLFKTREDIAIKVKSGRVAQIALLKVDKILNDIDIAKNGIESKLNELKTVIFTLSGISLKKSIGMQKIAEINKEKIFALIPLESVLKAKQLGIKASTEALYPSIMLKAKYAQNYAKGYNNDKSLSTGFGLVGLYLNIPLFDKKSYTQIKKAKVIYNKERLHIEDTKKSLEAKAQQIEKDLKILEHSEQLAKKSISINENLLKVAKISYSSGRMNEEEYLRYENELFNAYVSFYNIDAKRWQNIAQLAVIYGNDLREIVR